MLVRIFTVFAITFTLFSFVKFVPAQADDLGLATTSKAIKNISITIPPFVNSESPDVITYNENNNEITGQANVSIVSNQSTNFDGFEVKSSNQNIKVALTKTNCANGTCDIALSSNVNSDSIETGNVILTVSPQ